MRRSRTLACCLIATMVISGCGQWGVSRDLASPYMADLKPGHPSRSPQPYLMAHMRNGDVYILRDWQRLRRNDSPASITAESARPGDRLVGLGTLRDMRRELVREGRLTIPVDSVVLFETNSMVSRDDPAIIVGAVAALAVLVAIESHKKKPPPPPPSPEKVGYGSCPTFYVSDGERPTLRAEGFSASVARILEARDVDALPGVRPRGREFEVVMRNEALETHVLRYVRLLAARRLEGGRVFAASNGSFWQASEVLEPLRCVAPEGDCGAALKALDGIERFVPADSIDLATRETLEVEFASVGAGRWGLVVASRQSLLGTFLFYRALGYLGSSAGHWLAEVERGDPVARERSEAIWRTMGGIEVSTRADGGEWTSVGEVNETGPLATDVRVLPMVRTSEGRVTIRLRLARGHWRLDQVALVRLESPVEPIRIEPAVVRRGALADESARMSLSGSTPPLVTLPGDEYRITYQLPQDFDAYELFLETRGYYYEWIREEWLAEENPARAALMFLNPAQALRDMAPEYKQVEKQWETHFWNSRYALH